MRSESVNIIAGMGAVLIVVLLTFQTMRAIIRTHELRTQNHELTQQLTDANARIAQMGGYQ